ncbi:MAG TPA: hypothetical protein VEA16_10040, partial [Vicinamibacterales bacterium]|nr:hypothetical protein [Vicinamibacterales bacterium]
MCGIAGFVNLDGAPADIDLAARMADMQRHRGPDDFGLGVFSFAEGSYRDVSRGTARVPGFEGALGFNRLKILDLSDCGHQPMANADRNIV